MLKSQAGWTKTWLFERPMKGPWLTDCPPTVKAADTRNPVDERFASCFLGSKRLTYLQTNRFCSQVGLDDWKGVKWGQDVCWRISRRHWEMTYSRQSQTFAVRSMFQSASGNRRPGVFLWTVHRTSERETACFDERHANSEPRLHRIPGWNTINPHIPVTYLGFEFRSVHEGDRRGFTVKLTAKNVDECLDIVQMQKSKAVMTPLTEQKSLNLHDETTACDQVQHSLFRAVVVKLQYSTGVRPDLMFAKTCLSCKLASTTLADLKRSKKVLSFLNGTWELNLYLTILALKSNDLNKSLKHVKGYSDADWAGDPVTKKSTSCTPLRWSISVDEWMSRTGDCCFVQWRIRNVCSWCTVSWVDFCTCHTERNWTIILIHARADSSTLRAMATKQGKIRKMKHIHMRFLFIQDRYFGNFERCHQSRLNPSDFRMEALGRERFHRLRSMLGMVTELSETSSPVKWYSGDEWLCESLDTGMLDWAFWMIHTCEQA